MSNEQQGKLPVPLASVLAVVSLVVGVVLYGSTLKSDRPSDIRIGKTAIVGQHVLARLWEDPFEAIARHIESESGDTKSRTHTHSLEALRATLLTYQTPITVMAVLMESDPYAEGKEQRLRTRYAVLSALGEAGYAPVDGEHIDYFESAENVNVAFEWHEASPLKRMERSQTPKNVLVLWLPDTWTYQRERAAHREALCEGGSGIAQGGFLHDMANLLCDLELKPDRNDRTVSLRILGPTRSGVLRVWAKEAATLTEDTNAASADAKQIKELLNKTAIYSYMSTAAPALLYSSPGDPPFQDTKAEATPFEHLGITFQRTISSDYDLAKVLVRELEQRGVEILDDKNHEDHIALIAEWDTAYGRTLPLTFVAAALERANGGSFRDAVEQLKNRLKWPESHASDSTAPGKWIHSYVYLQGLDGVTSGKAARAPETEGTHNESKKPASDKKQNRFDTTYLERPEGQSQFDYIRRLTMSIQRDNERLQREGKQLRAIGVLGSDVYDKLLILQALRKNFSNVIFFTTDLDARLTHPDEFEWSRNLVVASSYGLELNHYWQAETPPFRSSYQTALYASALKALDLPVLSAHKTVVPRLYEIGRRGAVELPQGSAYQVAMDILQRDGWIPSKPQLQSGEQEIHPLPPPVLAKPQTLIGALLAPALLVCMITFLHQRYWSPGQQFSARRCFRFLRMFIGLGLLVLLLYVFVQVQLEPLSMFDGISIWPTELIRIMVIVFSLYCLRKAKQDLAKGDQRIARLFHLPVSDEAPREWARFRVWWPSHDDAIRSGKVTDDTRDKKEDASTSMACLWEDYQRSAQWGTRWIRVAWLMILALVIAAVIMSLFEAPFVPFRGMVSQWSDHMILITAILMTNALLFIVLEASLLAAQTIRKCTETIPAWSQTALQACAGKRVISETDLQARLTIQFIGMLTGIVGKLIYYPFIAVALLLAARSHYFDNWDFSLGLILVFAMNLTYALASAFILRTVAEQARAITIERVQAQLMHVEGNKELTDNEAEQIKRTIDEISKNREGAFASFLYQPAFGASLIPTSGITLLALLEYFVPGK